MTIAPIDGTNPWHPAALMSLCKRTSHGRLLSPVPWDRVVAAPCRIARPLVLVDIKESLPPGSAPSSARHALFAVQHKPCPPSKRFIPQSNTRKCKSPQTPETPRRRQ